MIHIGDCLEVMRTLDANSVDAIVTDPPYHLTTGKKGGTGAASLNPNSPAGRSRISTGFMGQGWDGGDVAFRPETWAEALRVAKPGAYLVAFGGTRTFHRLAVAIEDAGWELRDSILRLHEGGARADVALEDCPWLLGWVFGSGFPKSLNLEGEREGWGTALKPAFEPIVLARKPFPAGYTVAGNVAAYGTGALNIDGCRIESEGGQPRTGEASQDRSYGDSGATNFAAKPGPRGGDPAGRWPANLMHDGSAPVLAHFPAEAGASAPVLGTEPSRPAKNVYGEFKRGGGAFHGDSGSAARFFYCPKASNEDRNDGLEAFRKRAFGMSHAAAAAAKGEHYDNGDGGMNRTTLRENHHPTVKPTELMRWLVRLVTPPRGVVLDMFAGSGSTGRAAILEGFQFVGIEKEADFAAIAEARIRAVQPGLSFG